MTRLSQLHSDLAPPPPLTPEHFVIELKLRGGGESTPLNSTYICSTEVIPSWMLLRGINLRTDDMMGNF